MIQAGYLWACVPPINYEKVGGAGLRARQTVRTGWKACATGKNFSEQTIFPSRVGCALRTFIMHRRDARATKFSITFQDSRSWAGGSPVKHEKVGGAGLRARQAVRTGWKACATGRTFQDSHSWAFGPPLNYEKFLMSILLTLNLEP